ncbi:MAG: Type 1 glutamine amidotransferase-like domain-containing protein [Saprospiraceae bacterium]|nr:Type 1 glutamine amidotransferase-like domain-containing protein [Saprospiraceae bacterium]
MNFRKFLLLLLFPGQAFSQNYTYYHTGNTVDTVVSPTGGMCMMGGATEHDNAMKWFLQRANGGDVLVLRASGSDGYNDYLYNQLGIHVNSVTTIVCHNAAASNAAFVQQKISQAEAIWFAGGDQWDYVSFWRNTPVDSLINLAIQQRNIVFGGTSAGMAILGKYYFTAQNGTTTSAVALANPYAPTVAIDSSAFIHAPFLSDVITDTHFDNPDRRGRLVAFLSRIVTDYGVQARAIACDEYTAVCIAPIGIAKVYGDAPTYDDNAYFIQANCELNDTDPEVCQAGTPLTWNLNGEALKVYQIKGTSNGTKVFNLNNWKMGIGGSWLHWSVANGVFTEQAGTEIECPVLSENEPWIHSGLSLYPNPAAEKLYVSREQEFAGELSFQVFNALGQQLPIEISALADGQIELDIRHVKQGINFLQITHSGAGVFTRVFAKE